MLKRILVANRGEIAMRIIRAAKQLGIGTVAVYSAEDADSMPVRFADRAVCIGGAAASASYLNKEIIVQTALSTGCDGIHPGYGFLSENAEFAQLCRENGVVFVGPSPEVIRAMGDKQAARKLMAEHGVPTVPGSDGAVETAAQAAQVGDSVGYPILIKAAAGGGGRGMRIAGSAAEVESAFGAAFAEAESAFGDGRLYVEKLIQNPRHIEVQILGDGFGNVIHLGERDCSLQRRNQKMIEESPACALTDETRQKVQSSALTAAKAVGYTGAGTVEFVADRSGAFYFIEMNTRIQVEHPVTEAVTGVDLVREQLLIASGGRLLYGQSDISPAGAAIECRINAEDISRDFAPTPGTVTELTLPCGAGVRVETALFPGARISPWYDSMIAKIIVHAPTRGEAILKMSAALDETVVAGVPTNVGFLKSVMNDPAYIAGEVDTSFIGKFLTERNGKCR